MRRNGAVLGALLLAAVWGCTGGERYATEEQASKVQTPLTVAMHSQLVDIPVPGVFRFDRNNSMISTSTSERSASLVYTGRAHIERVSNFYSDQMPQRGWTHKKTQVAGSRCILKFVKGKLPERCQVTIEKGTTGTVRVTVDVN